MPSSLPWKPQLFYRYASFSGGGNRGFDPLFTGLSDWGSWFQGEVLGEFVLSNSNLNSHQVRLKLQPNDHLTLNLIHYKFLLFNRNQDFGITPEEVASRSLADEVDVILDVSPADWWSMTRPSPWRFQTPAFGKLWTARPPGSVRCSKPTSISDRIACALAAAACAAESRLDWRAGRSLDVSTTERFD